MVLTVVAALLLWVFSPPARLLLMGASDDGTLAGALHVHTNRSDGRGSPDEVAAAARRAGLKFVVFTDHGDGTRVPDPPAYRSGVLCLDGVEISTTGGHYIAIGMTASPYPLGGEPRDVVEDVRRLGGFGIAAHVDSPKADLRWSDWDAPIDAVEILNPDSGWRAQLNRPGIRPKLQLLAALGSYPFVPEETIGSLLGDPSAALDRWRSLADRRPVVAIAGVDAHAKLALWDVESGDNRFTLPFPGYGAAFRTLSVHVRPDRPLSGDAVADADLFLRALRAGHVYTAVDALATPPYFEFSALAKNDALIKQGSSALAYEPLRLRVRSNAPRGFTTTVWEGARALTTDRRDQEFTLLVPQGPASYRVEIRAADRPGRPLWIVSNPIYAGRFPALHSAVERPPPAAPDPSEVVVFPAADFGWAVEHDPATTSEAKPADAQIQFSFTLGPDRETRPYAALVAPPLNLAEANRVTLRMRADRPMRLSVQLRAGAEGMPEERWQRSVYVDSNQRDVTVAFGDMTPVGATSTQRPALSKKPSLILVVDTANTKSGAAGQVWIRRATIGR
jgi:hypothetical protein